jgi:hypothetical protein
VVFKQGSNEPLLKLSDSLTTQLFLILLSGTDMNRPKRKIFYAGSWLTAQTRPEPGTNLFIHLLLRYYYDRN